MIQNTGCQILVIYTTGHLGFDFFGYTLFLNVGHGKAKLEMDKHTFSCVAEGDGLALDIIALLNYLMMKHNELQFIAAAGLDLRRQAV